MLQRVLKAVLVAIGAGLILLLVGLVLDVLKVPPATTVGGFLVAYCWVIGVLVGLWYFLSGGSLGIGGL